LTLAFFVAGAALSAAWFSRGGLHSAADAGKAEPAGLSDATKAVLQHLDSPVEIRFYSMVSDPSVPDSDRAFAGRVGQLLEQYQEAAGDRLKVTRSASLSGASAAAALADGVKAFNIDKGDSCFLGIAVVCAGGKQSLPRLAPEWEQALEPDLTRAIATALENRPNAQPTVRGDTRSADAVRKAIPNLDTVSVEDGAKTLHDVSMGQFIQAVEETKTRMQEAEQRFIQAQDSQSPAAQQAAAEDLRKIQAEGARKLQQIAQESQAQILALQQLKNTGP
jgi:enamine deaminase RidA (YjgF/YER057c/UK114 family)